MVRSLLCFALLAGCCPEPTSDVDEYASVDVDRIAADLQLTEAVSATAFDPPVVTYEVVMYSATWCGPCQRWKRDEKSKVKTKLVIEEFKSNGPSHIRVFPTFVLRKVTDGKAQDVKRWEGYTAAATINKELP